MNNPFVYGEIAVGAAILLMGNLSLVYDICRNDSCRNTG